MYYVYVLENIATNRLYIGQTSNLSQRLKKHNTGKSPYTRARGPWKLIGTFILKFSYCIDDINVNSVS